MPTPLGYSGQRADDAQPSRRASDSDAWLAMSACLPYAVPVETVVRPRPARAPRENEPTEGT